MLETPSRGLRARIVEEIYTYCAFWIALSALPALAISFIIVRVSKHIWLKILSSRYPHLEFIETDTIRSLLDTHRNQGIINVLLTIKGTLNDEEIKRHLTEHVLERRDSNGEYMFPRLRHQLVSYWGNYAWDVNVPFRVENHFIIANAVHRGRPVSDHNIQDYISEIVSKYFPSDQPPWQYIIIPHGSTEPQYHILVRVHHLLLTGKNSINIGDLLLVEQTKSSEMTPQGEYIQPSPLMQLLPTPSAIPELIEKINEMMSNAWNEFVSEYDPVESTRALKSLPGVFHVGGLLVLSAVSALRELTKKKYNGRGTRITEPSLTAANLVTAIRRECKRRDLTLPKLVLSPLVTVDPRKWPKAILGGAFTALRTTVRLPIMIREETLALREFQKTGHVYYPNTFTWKYAGLIQLTTRAAGEAWHGLTEAYRAPIHLWTDTIRSDTGQRHVLQTVSLCGRKVAAWSKPVSRASVERAARALGVSTSDISIYAATEALRAFFEQTHNKPPEVVLTTARAASEDFLFTFAEGEGKAYKKSQTGGMVCLSLPLGASPRRVSSHVSTAARRHAALAAACSAQARCGALSRAVPSPAARLALNLLSRRFAVSYAEVMQGVCERRRMLWGQTLYDVLYWRPPQANISMSLTVIQYADSIRLAVMSDSRLVPSHTIPAVRYAAAIEQLVAKIDQEIARISGQAIPKIVKTEAEPSTSEEVRTEESGKLRPPTTEVVSPPPVRKSIAHSS